MTRADRSRKGAPRPALSRHAANSTAASQELFKLRRVFQSSPAEFAEDIGGFVEANGGFVMTRWMLGAAAATLLCAFSSVAMADQAGAVTGGVAGAVGGAAVGGPVGAIVGGVGGAAIGASVTNHRRYYHHRHHHYAYRRHRHYEGY